MRDLLPDCKFNNCQHLNEPKCAVKQAFVEDRLSESRYLNYVKMMEEDENETFRKDAYK
jgi:ribosome biogenesis GTPase